jgi:hypothetical protein
MLWILFFFTLSLAQESATMWLPSSMSSGVSDSSGNHNNHDRDDYYMLVIAGSVVGSVVVGSGLLCLIVTIAMRHKLRQMKHEVVERIREQFPDLEGVCVEYEYKQRQQCYA